MHISAFTFLMISASIYVFSASIGVCAYKYLSYVGNLKSDDAFKTFMQKHRYLKLSFLLFSLSGLSEQDFSDLQRQPTITFRYIILSIPFLIFSISYTIYSLQNDFAFFVIFISAKLFLIVYWTRFLCGFRNTIKK